MPLNQGTGFPKFLRCKYTVTHPLLPTSFGIHWLFLPEATITSLCDLLMMQSS